MSQQGLLVRTYTYVWQRMKVTLPSSLWLGSRQSTLQGVILTEDDQPLQDESGNFLLVE